MHLNELQLGRALGPPCCSLQNFESQRISMAAKEDSGAEERFRAHHKEDTHDMKLKQGLTSIIMAAAVMACLVAPKAQADDTSANISIGKMVSNLKISGDIRVRQDSMWQYSPGAVDRSRQRIRFRLGIAPQIQDITVFFRMGTGTGEQTSTNQSFDNGFTLKQIWVDQAYLQWKAFEWLKLSGGKMQNPIWRTYASDLAWDDDLNPEGFAEQFDVTINDRFGFFANFGQFPLDEDSTNNRDQWMFANQIGLKSKIMEETKWTNAVNFNYFKDEAANDWAHVAAGGVAQQGNSRVSGTTTGALRSSFTVVGVTSEINTRLWKWPLAIQADYLINEQDNSALGSLASEAKIGYQVGFQLNKAAAAKSWEAAYYFKYSESNATPADLADSDFGGGGTNRRGHIWWLAYAPRDYVVLKAKFLCTENLEPQLNAANSINRMQIDVAVKF